jgi:hypothetical protein
MTSKVICPYCEKDAELVSGKEIYKNFEKVHDHKFWRCLPCDAQVGTHLNSKKNKPFGTLANKKLRMLRKLAHGEFDINWKNAKERKLCYSWLAVKLGIKVEKCHIGMFDEKTCEKVMEICREAK